MHSVININPTLDKASRVTSLVTSACKLVSGLYEDKRTSSLTLEQSQKAEDLKKILKTKSTTAFFRLLNEASTINPCLAHYIASVVMGLIHVLKTQPEGKTLNALAKEYGDDIPVEILSKFYNFDVEDGKIEKNTASTIIKSLARVTSFGIDVASLFAERGTDLAKALPLFKAICDYLANGFFNSQSFSLPKDWATNKYNHIQKHMTYQERVGNTIYIKPLDSAPKNVKNGQITESNFLSSANLIQVFMESVFLAYYMGRKDDMIPTPCCSTKLPKRFMKDTSYKDGGNNVFECPCCNMRILGKVTTRESGNVQTTTTHYGYEWVKEPGRKVVEYEKTRSGERIIRTLTRNEVNAGLIVASKAFPNINVTSISEDGLTIPTPTELEARVPKFVKELWGSNGPGEEIL